MRSMRSLISAFSASSASTRCSGVGSAGASAATGTSSPVGMGVVAEGFWDSSFSLMEYAGYLSMSGEGLCNHLGGKVYQRDHFRITHSRGPDDPDSTQGAILATVAGRHHGNL